MRCLERKQRQATSGHKKLQVFKVYQFCKLYLLIRSPKSAGFVIRSKVLVCLYNYLLKMTSF